MQSVYIATNQSYVGLCKIGYSKNAHPSDRIKDLYSTGVLHPYNLYFFITTENGRALESKIHKFLKHCREKKDREFFNIEPETAKKILLLLNEEKIQDDEIYSIKEEKIYKRKRAENINLLNIGLQLGDLLQFSKDENIECIVNSSNTVIFKGEELTLTEAARKTGLINHKELQGSRYWTYKDESITNIRKKKEHYS
jgi:hypothetical protein